MNRLRVLLRALATADLWGRALSRIFGTAAGRYAVLVVAFYAQALLIHSSHSSAFTGTLTPGLLAGTLAFLVAQVAVMAALYASRGREMGNGGPIIAAAAGYGAIVYTHSHATNWVWLWFAVVALLAAWTLASLILSTALEDDDD